MTAVENRRIEPPSSRKTSGALAATSRRFGQAAAMTKTLPSIRERCHGRESAVVKAD